MNIENCTQKNNVYILSVLATFYKSFYHHHNCED